MDPPQLALSVPPACTPTKAPALPPVPPRSSTEFVLAFVPTAATSVALPARDAALPATLALPRTPVPAARELLSTTKATAFLLALATL